ncbi:MAG: glycosyltransferase family 39 protein [Gallionella sp.]
MTQLAATPWFNLSVVISLWFFACFWNFGKAFHMDDTGHLEIAHWIAANPWRPMSGMLSWGEDFQPIYNTNQPHLYFYLMAIWGSLFGWTETSMHLLMSFFTFWAIYAFYRIANFISPDSGIIPTALFALSPAFVVGQNSMVDIPLIAVWIEFYWALLNPKLNERNRYLIGALLCSAALLIKYTSLVLLPALVFLMILRKQYKQLVWGLLPIIILAIWSAFNFYDYGGFHILERNIGNRTSPYSELAISWLRVLGAITPFAVLAFIAMIYRSTSVISRCAWLLMSIFNLLTFSIIFWFFIASPSDDVAINILLKWLFLINGAALILLIVTNALNKVINDDLNITQLTLLYWLVSSAIFIIALAPFMATRHVLLVIPPIVLLLYFWVIDGDKARKFVMAVIILNLMVTSLLAMADCWYADIYRRYATLIADSLPKQSTIWFDGNWGWQWYASQSGMQQFSLIDERPKPKAGDFIVSPQRVCCKLPTPREIKLELYQKIIIPRDSRVSHFASSRFYYTVQQAWGYYNIPIEQFVILRVLDEQAGS